MPAHTAKRPGASIVAADIEGARKSAYPGFIEPSHPTLMPKPPRGEKWVHEVKVDGYRLQLHIGHGKPRAYTRRGHDWSARFAARLYPRRKLSSMAR